MGSRRTAPHWLFILAVLFSLTACDEVNARRRIQEGNKLYHAGKYEEAIREYDSALASRPELAIGWYNLGLAHLALFAPGAKTPDNDKHANGAIAAFNKYLELVPGDTKARDYLLSTYIDSGQYQGALAYFERQLRDNPKNVEALAQLAQINAQAGNFEEANRWHRRRVEVETSTDAKADALYSIGVLDWRRLNNHPEVAGALRVRVADEGIAALQEAERLRPDHQATLTYMNLLYRERALGSEASFARAVDLATAQVHYKRAMELMKKAQEPHKANAAATPAHAPADKL